MSYSVVLFVHNTVSEYHRFVHNDPVEMFIGLSFAYVKNRADLDCRPTFATYSDDTTMVQIIGDITIQMRTNIINQINNMRRKYGN